MKGGAAIAEVLKREGVDRVFCFPANPLIDAAAGAGIRPIVARMERVMMNMADGYTRAGNAKPIGVCMMQGGPGIEHAFGGVAQAYADSTPLLVLPGGSARSRSRLPTSFEARDNYAHITKWADTFSSAQRVPDQMRRAFSYLRSGRPGPVLLETPGDVVAEEFDDAAFHYTPVPRLRSSADPDAVREVVKLLLSASRPLIHVGQGVLWAEATRELVEFAELVQAPVMTTLPGKGAMPENHPLAIGVGAVSVTPAVKHFLPQADLLFSIGAGLARTLGSVGIPAGKKMIQCTTDERDLNAEYALDGALMGDAKLVLGQLCEELRRQLGTEGRAGDDKTRREIADAKARGLEAWLPKLTSDEAPINPYRIVWELNRNVDKATTIITHDSGHPRDHLAPFYEVTTPRGYIGWGNSTPLGSSLGLALGAKMAQPSKLVINVLGDTGFGQCGMDLETATRERIPILTVLINNSAMGGYDRMQPVAQEKFNIKRMSGDYTGVAKALGAYAERVEKPADIAPAIKRAQEKIAGGQTALLEFITREDTSFLRA
ncbi:MAG: thiamine pyrophosphate-requiring protein [Chloroflexota bacterium]